MSLKSYAITAGVSLAVGAAGAWYLAPRRVETKTIEKWRTVTIRDTKRVRVTTKPDGTRIEEHTETATHIDTKDAFQTHVSNVALPRWNVSLLGGVDLHLQPVFGAQANYRLVGPFTVGAWGIGGTAGTAAAGVSLGVTF